MQLRPGSVLEKYKIIRMIGSGGAGTVYEAQHTTLERPVALKLLHGYALNDKQVRERFIREAKVMTKLHHPNSVEVFDYGEVEGHPFIVMELLEGHPLEKEIMEGTLDLERSLLIMIQICDVLSEAHQIGLVHRDIKPENIFISDKADSEGPHAILVDFGLAFIEEDQKLSRLTRDGEVAGTPQFLSPEQAIASPHIGPPSDVYSLGCVFYEMLTGKPAFEGATILKLLNAHLYMNAQSLRLANPSALIPAAIDDLVLSMLAKKPSKRPPIEEVGQTLRRIIRSDDVRGRGKPSTFFEDREDRAITSNFIRRQTAGAPAVTRGTPDNYLPDLVQKTETDTVKQLGVIGEISPDLMAVSHTANWIPSPFIPGKPYDIVVVIDNEAHIEIDVIKNYPTIVSTLSDSMDEITMLLQAGVEDVLTNPTAEDVIRKVQRLYRTISRKKRGKSKQG